jgi:hypothetical protein
MSLAEFNRGLSSQEIEYHRERARSEQLKEQHRRWDDSFMILRPSNDQLPTIEERFKLWKENGTH